MKLDPATIAASLFFSTVGFIYFRHGKKQLLPNFMVIGAILMGYGYFVDKLWVNIALGVGLSAAPFVFPSSN